MHNAKTAIIIGAGPAGLTAAHELLQTTDIVPIIFEATDQLGGISRTCRYKGNRIDIGGHRFFSKSDRVMDWWQNILPIQGAPARDDLILGRDSWKTEAKSHRRGGEAPRHPGAPAPDPETADEVMLVRQRLSRIMFLRTFFDYPVSLTLNTVRNLGFRRMVAIAISYTWAKCFPIRHMRSLEDFFINQFGSELYKTFFRDYTEKVWGVPCHEIPADWGAQRIKGLSLSKALAHAIKRITSRNSVVDQKTVETSLIESFLYPKFGPGQLWETVAARVQAGGGQIQMQHRIVKMHGDGDRITAVDVENTATGERSTVMGDYFFSSMPVRELIAAVGGAAPTQVQHVASGLQYRDFMTVGILAKKLLLKNPTPGKSINDIIPDNWIYIQESDVSVGRLQIYNNWSPYLTADPDLVWVGMEYFCNEGDQLWSMADDAFASFAVSELAKIGMVDADDVLDTTVIRVPKAYPAYFGTFAEFGAVREYLDGFSNLFLVGRNGMHRYNNMDHSMLSAMTAVENIITGKVDKDNIWSINAEADYHESKAKATDAASVSQENFRHAA